MSFGVVEIRAFCLFSRGSRGAYKKKYRRQRLGWGMAGAACPCVSCNGGEEGIRERNSLFQQDVLDGEVSLGNINGAIIFTFVLYKYRTYTGSRRVALL